VHAHDADEGRHPPDRPAPGTVLGRSTRALRAFLRAETSGGVVLLAGALVGLALANSPLRDAYRHLQEVPVTIGVGSAALSMSVEHWINDGLMALFFFTVGLEIKRELLVGELASPARAALPVAAAAGGAILPALIYVAVNAGGPHAGGWGVPMATDIAFAVGVLAILGSRVPDWLRTFVVALAIVDDVIAVLVIAAFYTSDLAVRPLLLAGGLLALLVALNLLGARRPAWYVLPGLALWGAVLASGVHATVAGVLVAATIPARSRTSPAFILERLRRALDLYASGIEPGPGAAGIADAGDADAREARAADVREAALEELERAVARWETPLFRLEHRLLPWTTYLVLPLFAFVNAGVTLAPGAVAATLGGGLGLGILAGLLVGKPLGILGGTWVAARLGPSGLPPGARWREVLGAALLGGIGFTMSLFIAALAFGAGPALARAKIAILAASTLAAIAGYLTLARAGTARPGRPERSPT